MFIIMNPLEPVWLYYMHVLIVLAIMEPCEALSPNAGMIPDACHCQATCISFAFLVCSFVACFSLVSKPQPLYFSGSWSCCGWERGAGVWSYGRGTSKYSEWPGTVIVIQNILEKQSLSMTVSCVEPCSGCRRWCRPSPWNQSAFFFKVFNREDYEGHHPEHEEEDHGATVGAEAGDITHVAQTKPKPKICTLENLYLKFEQAFLFGLC